MVEVGEVKVLMMNMTLRDETVGTWRLTGVVSDNCLCSGEAYSIRESGEASDSTSIDVDIQFNMHRSFGQRHESPRVRPS